VFGEEFSDCLPADRLHDASPASLLSKKGDCPTCSALRWVRACESYDLRLLTMIEQGRRTVPVILGQRVFETSLQVAPPNPANLPRIRAEGCRDASERVASVEHLQRSEPPPLSVGERVFPTEELNLRAVGVVERKTRKSRTLRALHPKS